MIMVITIIFIFLSYGIFDQQLKITFRKSQAPRKKSTPLLKIQKFQVPYFWPTLKLFQASRAERVVEDSMNSVIKCEIKALGQMLLCPKI